MTFDYDDPFHLFNIVKKFLKERDILVRTNFEKEILENLCSKFYDQTYNKENLKVVVRQGLRLPTEILTWYARTLEIENVTDYVSEMSKVYMKFKRLFESQSQLAVLVRRYKGKGLNDKLISQQLEISQSKVIELSEMELKTREDYPELCKEKRFYSPTFDALSEINNKKTKKKFRENMESLRYKPGVYFLYNSNKKLTYIGKSTDLGSRIPSSVEERKAFYYSYAITETSTDAGIYEMYYIGLLKPKLNVEGKFHDDPSVELPELEKVKIQSVY